MYSIEITTIYGEKKVETHLGSYLAHVLAQKALKQSNIAKVQVFDHKHQLEETYEKIKREDL